MRSTNQMFEELIVKMFGFLISSGFRRTTLGSGMIDFYNDDLEIRFTYDAKRSYEANMYVTIKKNKQSFLFDAGQLCEFLGRQSVGQSATTEIALEKVLRNFESILRELIPMGLGGNTRLHKEIAKFSEESASAHEEQIEKNDISNRLADLWAVKNYAGVVALLEPRKEKLNPLERKKYEYAKKHIM